MAMVVRGQKHLQMWNDITNKDNETGKEKLKIGADGRTNCHKSAVWQKTGKNFYL